MNLNFLINYFLNYARYILIDEFLGLASHLRENDSEIYKFDPASFAVKTDYKTEKGNNMWGHLIVLSSKYHSDGKTKQSSPKPDASLDLGKLISQSKSKPAPPSEEIKPLVEKAKGMAKISVIKEEELNDQYIKNVINKSR